MVALFINKLDKLFDLFNLTADKIYEKINNIVLSLNAIAFGFLKKNSHYSYRVNIDNYFSPEN